MSEKLYNLYEAYLAISDYRHDMSDIVQGIERHTLKPKGLNMLFMFAQFQKELRLLMEQYEPFFMDLEGGLKSEYIPETK